LNSRNPVERAAITIDLSSRNRPVLGRVLVLSNGMVERTAAVAAWMNERPETLTRCSKAVVPLSTKHDRRADMS
jgi:hypothetical protein